MFRFPRWTSWSLRIPAKNGPLNIQRARIITNPRQRTGILLAAPLIIYIGIRTFPLVVPGGFQGHVDAVTKDLNDVVKKRQQLEKEIGDDARALESIDASRREEGRLLNFKPFWVPIPLWTYKVKPPDYSPSDPEWQEFLKLEQDAVRVKKLKSIIGRDVAEAVAEGLSSATEKSWGFEQGIGYNSSHIDFVFPWGPPHVYQRPGLLITPNGVIWTKKRLPDERGRRFYRIFHPTIFALSFWDGGKAFCIHYYSAAEARLIKLLGFEQKSSKSHVAGSSLSAAQKAQLKKAFKFGDSTDYNPILPASAWSKNGEDVDLVRMMIPPPAPNSALEAAVKAYKRTHTNLQAAAWKECPRGGCWLTGFVDVIGTRATVRVTVKAIYLPAKDIFLGSPIVVEAVVMPKVSQVTADKLKKEKRKEQLRAQTSQATESKDEKVKMDPTKKDPGEGTSPE